MGQVLRRAIHSSLIGVMFALGCSGRRSEYVGKWVNNGDKVQTLEISRNGDQFRVKGLDNTTITATYKDGSLEIPAAEGPLTLRYVKSSDSLKAEGIFGEVDYRRAK